MLKLLAIVAIGVGVAWYLLGDPRNWPRAVAAERERLPAQLKEALEAGKRAATRREQEVQAELADALGNQPGAGI